jgi:hypothetical protein
MVYTVHMTELTKRLHYENFQYGDIVRLTRAVAGSSGKRFKFVGAVYDESDDINPVYLDLIEIGRGQMRAIRPEHVIKDVPASKAAQARIARKTASVEED